MIIGQQRFLTSTRGKIVALLRQREQTVEDLAQELGLTDNAVRAHLVALERDGLVVAEGTRPGKRKPSVVYRLAPAAEDLFPKAYVPVLRRLLDVLREHLGAETVDALLRNVGQSLASSSSVSSTDLHTRLEQAVTTLNALGGCAHLEQQQGAIIIRGSSCPLAALVPDHPEVCRLATALVSDLLGQPVEEQCERREQARCCFVVPAAIS